MGLCIDTPLQLAGRIDFDASAVDMEEAGPQADSAAIRIMRRSGLFELPNSPISNNVLIEVTCRVRVSWSNSFSLYGSHFGRNDSP